jgi:cysteine desulfurase
MTATIERHIYFDHSATTPVDPQVVEAMLPYFTGAFGNASSIHSFGQKAKVALEDARRQVASLLGAEPSELIFTSCGTEADNWAIKGAAHFFEGKKKHLITSMVEHHAVLFTCNYLHQHGFDVTYLPVDKFGMVSPQSVADAIRDDTFLVSIMHANNEVGTVNPISEIGKICRERGVLFHTDAVQTVGKLPINVNEMNIDLLSLSAHKFYGPKGVGALFMRRGLQLDKLIHGGHQERDRRAGTENVAGVVGLGKAAELCQQRMEEDERRLAKLSGDLYSKLKQSIGSVYLNGHESQRLPGTLNLSFDGVSNDSLMQNLDLKGIAVSGGSACNSGMAEASHVLNAMGLPMNLILSAVRFSLGRDNNEEDIDYAVEVLTEVVERLRTVKKKNVLTSQ